MSKRSCDLEKNISFIRQNLGEGPDIVFRRFMIGGSKKAAVFFLDGMSNAEIINQDVLRPLMLLPQAEEMDLDQLLERFVCVGNVKTMPIDDKLVDEVFLSKVVLLVDGEAEAASLEIIKVEHRSISEPSTDTVVRGPREGFVENIQSNITLMRRKIRDKNLQIEKRRIGRYSNTLVCLVYIKGVVNEGVLRELRQRLQKIDIDGILESSYIESLIEDAPLSIFPTVRHTEKPDILTAQILEGRVGILIDGTPIALSVPMLFIEGFQSSEDYYGPFYYSSLVRMLRYLSFAISVFLPGIYVMITNYHQQLVPANLLLAMVTAEQSTPFSTGMSLLVMGVIYEVLREAGVRLPRPVGQAVSIVGAIVMGDAAVSASLISAPVLIIVAVTVIASFVTETFVSAATILRMIFLFLGWSLGGFGMLAGILVMLLYLSSLRSFGVAYFAPLAPVNFKQWGDAIVRLPLWLLQKRPEQLSNNRRRMAAGMMPQDGIGKKR